MLLQSSHPVLCCAEAQAYESLLLDDDVRRIKAAMQSAGRGVGEGVLEDFKEIGAFPESARLLVLVGKGHNGGDALIAAQRILELCPGAKADLLLAFDEKDLAPLSHEAFDTLMQMGRCQVVSSIDDSVTYDVCVDSLLGMAFDPPLREPLLSLIKSVNAHEGIRFRAAVDLPSGVGEMSDAVAFRADFTYATGIAKAPIFVEGNREFVGRIRYLDIGFFGGRYVSGEERVLLPDILSPLKGLRGSRTHKRSYGHLLVIGGSEGMPGALLMALRSALHSGVGLVTACSVAAVANQGAAHVPEAMWLPCEGNSAGGLSLESKALILEKSKQVDAVLIGPGLGRDKETRALVRELVSEMDVPLVLDADALFSEVINAIPKRRSAIITPHLGEWRRLVGEESESGSLGQLREFSDMEEVLTVLKGPVTAITDGGELYWNVYGGPVLARGGSGDLLAGLIGGLLAQKPEEVLLSAAQGVVWYGMAADALAREQGQMAVAVTELILYLSKILHS